MTKNLDSTLNIALCGFGSAGRSRLKALDTLEGMVNAGIVSRRPELATLNWAEALMDPKIDAVAISTENTRHAVLVEAALKAGKHVLCDYPLCFSMAEGRALYQLAQDQNKILHVEHIGLLSKSHLQAKVDLSEKGDLISGIYEFNGGWSPALADLNRHGPAAFWAQSRLMQCADWFGAFEIIGHFIEHDAEKCVIDLQLEFQNGGRLHFVERREPGLARERNFEAHLTQGPFVWQSAVANESLFARDLVCFKERILSARACYYDEALMLAVIGQLSQLSVNDL